MHNAIAHFEKMKRDFDATYMGHGRVSIEMQIARQGFHQRCDWAIEELNIVRRAADCVDVIECPYCTSDNQAVRDTYFDQNCKGCVARM